MADSPTPFAEIDLGPSKLDQFLDAHQKKLIIVAILMTISLIAYVIYTGIAKGKAEDAGAALLSAKKVEDLQKVETNWKNSPAAKTAPLLIAQLQSKEKPEEAIKTLQAFLKNTPDHPVAGTAKVSLALQLLKQKKTSDATTILTEVAVSYTDDYIAPLAMITLGDIAKEAGKKGEAKTWYEKAKGEDENEINSFTDMAAERLSLVNAEPPKKIKPAHPTATQLPAPTPAALKKAGISVKQTPLTTPKKVEVPAKKVTQVTQKNQTPTKPSEQTTE